MRKKNPPNPCSLVVEVEGRMLRGTAAQLHEVNSRRGGWDQYHSDRDRETARRVAHTVAHHVAEAVVAALLKGDTVDTDELAFALPLSIYSSDGRAPN